jgi:hypothetical protein
MLDVPVFRIKAHSKIIIRQTLCIATCMKLHEFIRYGSDSSASLQGLSRPTVKPMDDTDDSFMSEVINQDELCLHTLCLSKMESKSRS